MATQTTERRGETAAKDDATPTAEQSWSRHAEVLQLAEQIRRNRARRHVRPGELRRPAES